MKPDKVPKDLLRYPAERYLACDPFGASEVKILFHKTELVKVREPRYCALDRQRKMRVTTDGYHGPDVVMWCESASVDGSFGRNYVCIPHMTIAIEFAERGERDPFEFSCLTAALYVHSQSPTCGQYDRRSPHKDERDPECMACQEPERYDDHTCEVSGIGPLVALCKEPAQ